MNKKDTEIKDMTMAELVEYLNSRDEDTIVSITFVEEEGGSHAGSKDI